MTPLFMAALLAVALAGFAWSARQRWRLLRIGPPGARPEELGRRLRRTMSYAFGQRRLTRYRLAGLAHKAIFFGFCVLLVRSLILFGRGFAGDPGFGYWALDRGTALGNVYALVKDVYIVLVVAGVLVFLYYRLVTRPPRLTLGGEGIAILVMILAMMVADVAYDGAGRVLEYRAAGAPAVPAWWEPLGSAAAPALAPLPETAVAALRGAGFWTHVCLVLAFLNLLPYSKHFHVITAIPNVFLGDLGPRGRLRPIEDFEGRVEREETLGVRHIGELSWKGILDLYSCTECGRCTDHCPASRTGKLLSPRDLTIGLRDHLYGHASPLLAGRRADVPDLVPAVVDPEVLWACTTCGACEQECPVLISYVDKIVDLRRHLVQERGEFPGTWQQAFQSMEVTGSPYATPAEDRLRWAEGLEVPLRAETDDPEILFWVGCAPASDGRARGIARAVARLLDLAGVRWAVLGPQERCTGDPARRAGNEYLFQAMARANVETLDGCGATRILTACPHCYNTLAHEYPDFGGRYEVVHHSVFLARLLAEGRLRPRHRVEAEIAYHDSCYLGRYNDVYDPPRAVLASIPGVRIVEPGATRDRGMCCGAGGGQMFKEEEPGDERVSAARARQLRETGAGMVATACPFCMRMMTDALDPHGEGEVEQLDIAEVVLRAVEGHDQTPKR